METKHTQGPWAVDSSFHLYEKDKYNIINAGTKFLPGGFSIAGIIKDADAKLIAAAPDLLEALELVVGSMSLERVERFDILEKCKAAIQKATEE